MTMLRLCYQTLEFGKIDIHMCTLRDNQEFHDPIGIAEKLGISSASWPIFGIIWPSSLVLAHFILDYQTDSKRILEVGCGMALTSLLLNKQLTDITATDYHPEVQTFLQRNTLLNGDKTIAFEQVDWAAKSDNLGLFDLIIGSDLLYEDEHIDLLASFIAAHANPTCEVIIVDPGRGRKNKLTTKMIDYGFTSTQQNPVHTEYLPQEFKGQILKFCRRVECLPLTLQK
ncbi:methyltransferase domain-containing protein [Aliiglaciecola sp. LCG003]|uniref:class I SAM-dependent methyltransferase n=1 Tax=Aliiglaciecola sp. LCG003 TaxID=3053655 RepID=UPI00257478BF|nr:methyltransferase domain-containing protein [Aliiglaciecola sp. LCG003]WJG07880.1 methyltransferase domain-containing protein [Aliiglaciecola sp. LCG003]